MYKNIFCKNSREHFTGPDGEIGSLLKMKFIADDKLYIYHEYGRNRSEGYDDANLDHARPHTKRTIAGDGKWLRHGYIPNACCGKLIHMHIPNFKDGDRLLLFVNNTGGPGYVAGEVSHNNITYFTKADTKNWNCLGILPGGTEQGFYKEDIDQNEFPAKGEPYLGNINQAQVCTSGEDGRCAPPMRSAPCENWDPLIKIMNNGSKWFHALEPRAKDQIDAIKKHVKDLGIQEGHNKCRDPEGGKGRGEAFCMTGSKEVLENLDKCYFGYLKNSRPTTCQDMVNEYGPYSTRKAWASEKWADVAWPARIQWDDMGCRKAAWLPDNDNLYGKKACERVIELVSDRRVQLNLAGRCKLKSKEDIIPNYIGKDLSRGGKSRPKWYSAGRRIGCFKDGADCENKQQLPTRIGLNGIFTHEQCRDKAMKQDSKYYGLQNGGECYMSPGGMVDNRDTNGQKCSAPNHECIMKSRAAYGQLTGGERRNDIYSTTEPPILSEVLPNAWESRGWFSANLLGKFTDKGKQMSLLKTEGASNTGWWGDGHQFHGWMVIEFKPTSSTTEFCSNPNYNEWYPPGCADRSTHDKCKASPMTYYKNGSLVGKFVVNDNLCKTMGASRETPGTEGFIGGPYSPIITNSDNSLSKAGTSVHRTNIEFVNIITLSIEKIRTTKIFPNENSRKTGHIYESDVNNYKILLNEILTLSADLNKNTKVIYSDDIDISEIITPITSAYQKWISNKDCRESQDSPPVGKGSDICDTTEIISKYNTKLHQLIKQSRIMSVLCQCIDDGSAPGIKGNKCPPCGLSPSNIANRNSVPQVKAEKIYNTINGVTCALQWSSRGLGNGEYQAKWDCGRENRLRLVDKGGNPSHKLGRCEGDCDSDNNCKRGLLCKQRSSSNVTIPGCISGGRGDNATHDYCYSPKSIFRGDARGDPVIINNGKIITKINNKTCGLEWDSNMGAKKWGGEKRNKFLGGYVRDRGRAYGSLGAAKAACEADSRCNGITQERTQKYTTRGGTVLGNSPTGENSWLLNRLVNKRNAKWDCNSSGDPLELKNNKLYTTADGKQCTLSYDKKRGKGARVSHNEYNAVWDCEQTGGLIIKST